MVFASRMTRQINLEFFGLILQNIINALGKCILSFKVHNVLSCHKRIKLHKISYMNAEFCILELPSQTNFRGFTGFRVYGSLNVKKYTYFTSYLSCVTWNSNFVVSFHIFATWLGFLGNICLSSWTLKWKIKM